MTNKLYITFFTVILIIAGACDLSFAAAPPNDDICSAITLSPLDGTCLASQTNSDATGDIYGGCIGSNYPTVWYSFSLTGSNNAVDITFENGTFGGDGEVGIFLLEGTCASPDGISTVCDNWTATFTFIELSTGVTYFFEVATQPGANQGNFDICVLEYENAGSITGPEQDCDGALPVCSSTYTTSSSYTGIWDNQEVSTSTCLAAGENNSVWFIFTAQANGVLEFLLTTTKDYDFALYDITTIGCAGVPSATPVRCNWSGTLGNTGILAGTATTKFPEIAVGAMGSPTMEGISDMTAGETYVLIVDNWTGDNTGFTLDFGASPIVDVTPPTVVSAAASCTGNTILITMSEDIKCLSIIPTGLVLFNNTTSTDVTIAMTEIIGFNCPITDGGLTKQIQITHDGSLTTGNYTITFNPPTPEDKCDNSLASGSTVSFDYLAAISMSASTNSVCTGGSSTLNADGADAPNGGAVYTLTPGGATNTTDGVFIVSPATTTTYTVTVTFGGCTKSAQQTITVEDNVVVTISPVDPQVCPGGNTTLIATTTINGVACASCDYQWSGASAQNDLGVASSTVTPATAGTYNVDVTTSAGCTSNTATSTVSEASGSPTTCAVYYVSPAGGGDGLTKTTPTDLATAITSAACTNSILKLQAGVYSLADRIVVTSYLTIEGGYDGTYALKSSDLSGGANTTVIRRSNAADSDDANGSTAFKINNDGVNFGFRDLRIELPGSPSVTAHAASSNMTNYGIRMGTGCTGYDIVRCYIDTGVGSEP